ncbi:MAG TPA: hypothetical protein VF510_24530 [Ktedonobacterales bacterium]
MGVDEPVAPDVGDDVDDVDDAGVSVLALVAVEAVCAVVGWVEGLLFAVVSRTPMTLVEPITMT